MDSISFYTETSTFKKRKTWEGVYDKRNTHNFIKSVLLSTFVKEGFTIIDLGCGKGGDVKKLDILKIGKYIGVDNCKRTLEICEERLSKTSIKDYTIIEKNMWEFPVTHCNIVSCQFSLHYAFESEEKADATICNISNCLEKGGLLLGTIPFYKSCFKKENVHIPGTELILEEPTVNKQTLQCMAKKYRLELKIWEPFLKYYENEKKKNSELAKKMSAFLKPDKKYTVFVFEKL